MSLRVQRGGKKDPVLSAADLQAVLPTSIPSEFHARRDLLAFNLLYRWGLRVSEIAALNIASVDLKRRRLMIRGLRGRSRYVHLQEPAIASVGGVFG